MIMLAPRSFLFTRQYTARPSPKPTSKPPKQDQPVTEKKNGSPSRHRNDMSTTSTITSPVVIPIRSHDASREQRSLARKERHHNGRRNERSERRARTVHYPDSIPPSVAALLAITCIPPQKTNASQRRGGSGQRLTVDGTLQQRGSAEKELSLSLARGPLDFLLSPPEELEDDDLAGSENGRASLASIGTMSTRTTSNESMPSLDNECTPPSPSPNSLVTPSPRGRKFLPKRSITPVSSPPGETENHPLFTPDIEFDELDFRAFTKPEQELEIEVERPRRSAFKSNLTASLRVLASAARSFSTLTAPMVTPDDFLTRSIISIDPQVPFTDERMPPRLEDMPTPALRRYLNPTTNAPIEAHMPSYLSQTARTKYTASIQMQTYKVSRSGKSTSPSVISRRTQPTSEDVFAEVAGPVARQRDMRENSDFIRIAVMEMAMRRKGKLDDQKPGRARWALPPRKPSTKPYEIGENGVPVRWIAVTH